MPHGSRTKTGYFETSCVEEPLYILGRTLEDCLNLHFGLFCERPNFGEMTEWFKVTVLKTVELKGSVSSNLTLSAKFYDN